MSETQFQANVFLTYKVVREGVSFGFIDTMTGGYVPSLNENIKYDGSTVILKDDREFGDAPQLRSAIREGWMVEVGNVAPVHRPKAAGIQVRPAESHGRDRPVRTTIETEYAEERAVVSVEDRKLRREAVNAEATRKVPLESQEARRVVLWDSGDEEINDIAGVFDEEMLEFQEGPELSVEVEDATDPEVQVKAQAESDILEMLNAVEEDTSAPTTKRRRKATPRAFAQERPPEVKTGSSRRLPVDNQDERPSMPIVREDVSANSGEVVGTVGDQQKVVVEREQEFALNVAQAKPENESPKPKPRFGGAGAIVVNEQRDMGQIALSSSSKAPIKLDESAAVSSSGNETIRMGERAQVGTRGKTAGRAPETDQGGVAVGRIVSPTTQSFVADASNTSASAIRRTAEGKQLKIEKYAVDPDQEAVAEAKAPEAVATGDVQEARVGESLEDLLPDAAKPEPEVYRRPQADPAYEAVRMLVPNFEWNKDRPVKERVADALKKVNEPLFVKGILAVETELAREDIKKGLAELLEKKKAKKKAKKKT